jgi:hydrogenase nickel incorporation protein HypA/HybF
MHEMSLFKNIMQKIDSISKEQEGKKILKMKIILGAHSHLSSSHFREHFDIFSKGTPAEGALLDIIEDSDTESPYAQEVILDSVEVEA